MPGRCRISTSARDQARRLSIYSSWSNLNTAASIYLKIKRYDQAHELLARLGPSLLKDKPADSDTESEKRQFSQQEYMYWTNMGKWARAAGRKLEALTYDRKDVLGRSQYQLEPVDGAVPHVVSARTLERNQRQRGWI